MIHLDVLFQPVSKRRPNLMRGALAGDHADMDLRQRQTGTRLKHQRSGDRETRAAQVVTRVTDKQADSDDPLPALQAQGRRQIARRQIGRAQGRLLNRPNCGRSNSESLSC